MNAFSHTEFLAEVSKSSKSAYMLVTVDPDLADGNRGVIDNALSMLDADAREKLEVEGGAIVVFEDIDDAIACYYSVERKLPTLANIDLFLSVFYEGYNQLNICQSPELRSIIAMETPSHATM
ncbi:hypothetical protein [Erythrobacter aureus]|uniref:Uncharacterized protein n=1 Tax=Erythrobacter aureus TaxID=2182384 RepID=A0A345YJ08_9SPHN|nr:hypothetical protein [Erythrobacter aureus]AXK43910.1 hypothetical protein DVR09_15765 [Erythrobacter aureus]